MRRRFFVEKFADGIALMEGAAAYHVGRVLRAHVGQEYELSDGERVFLGQIVDVARDSIKFSLREEIPAIKSSLHLTLLLSIVKTDAFEWALEKATELGVGTIVPLAAARSEKGLLGAAEKRSERWNRILLEASQQSRRVRLPTLLEVAKPAEAFATSANGIRIMLSERSDAKPLKAVLGTETAGAATLAIGPEGGWTDKEAEYAREAGYREASLGKLILRTETAVISAISSLNFALEK